MGSPKTADIGICLEPEILARDSSGWQRYNDQLAKRDPATHQRVKKWEAAMRKLHEAKLIEKGCTFAIIPRRQPDGYKQIDGDRYGVINMRDNEKLSDLFGPAAKTVWMLDANKGLRNPLTKSGSRFNDTPPTGSTVYFPVAGGLELEQPLKVDWAAYAPGDNKLVLPLCTPKVAKVARRVTGSERIKMETESLEQRGARLDQDIAAANREADAIREANDDMAKTLPKSNGSSSASNGSTRTRRKPTKTVPKADKANNLAANTVGTLGGSLKFPDVVVPGCGNVKSFKSEIKYQFVVAPDLKKLCQYGISGESPLKLQHDSKLSRDGIESAKTLDLKVGEGTNIKLDGAGNLTLSTPAGTGNVLEFKRSPGKIGGVFKGGNVTIKVSESTVVSSNIQFAAENGVLSATATLSTKYTTTFTTKWGAKVTVTVEWQGVAKFETMGAVICKPQPASTPQNLHVLVETQYAEMIKDMQEQAVSSGGGGGGGAAETDTSGWAIIGGALLFLVSIPVLIVAGS